MSPVPLLLLLSAALISESTSTPPENSTGLRFTVVFPENIAYYYPEKAKNKVNIIAFHHNTEVVINTHVKHITTNTLNAGETWEYEPNANLEIAKSEIVNKSLQIISNNMITVHVVNLKNNSLQTALFSSTDKLGKEYLIPPVPVINGTTHPTDMVTRAVTERGPFRLIIINADQENTVTVEGAVSKEVPLQPHQTAQIWINKEDELRAVKADQPVAVLFGHTCAIRYNCTCGQLYTMLPTATEEEQTFYIPPVLAADAEGETFVLLSEKDFTQVRPFNPNSPLVKTTGTAILYRPGLLLTLIPEADFAACSVVNSVPDAQNFAVIIVHKDLADGVHVGSSSLESTDWQPLRGTEYVSIKVVLSSGKNVIWHSSSKMAVYFVGTKEGTLFGNPAPIISKNPDFRGCILSPEVVKIGEVAGGWRESLKYCQENNLELVSLPKAQIQRQTYDKIVQANNESVKDVWIGMRRSSQTGEWYWLSKDPVSDTNWAEGEPGTVHDGQCAIMSLESSEEFGWRDEDCCKDAHPVCYSSPVFFPM